MKWQIRLSLHGLTRVDPVMGAEPWWGGSAREREGEGDRGGGPTQDGSREQRCGSWRSGCHMAAVVTLGSISVAYVMGDGPAERGPFWRGDTLQKPGLLSCLRRADAGRGARQPPAAPSPQGLHLITAPPPPGAGYFGSLHLSVLRCQMLT